MARERITLSISKECARSFKAFRTETGSPSMSAAFERLVADRQSRSEMEQLDQKLQAYYDSMKPSEIREDYAWGAVGEAALADEGEENQQNTADLHWPTSSVPSERCVRSRGQLPEPRRGQIWFVLFPSDPPGKYRRPVLIVSTDRRNTHPNASTVLAIPFSTTLTDVPIHLRLPPGETGLPEPSELQPENISTIRKDTLVPAV